MAKATSNGDQAYNVRLDAKMLYKPFIKGLTDTDVTTKPPNESGGERHLASYYLLDGTFEALLLQCWVSR